ncbi:quinoprotein dehydrogenase-associated putative ABC transporter substrate-binding protein [Nevskia soli]|uniref:quinoprotein dehydrogenase-associated putative ABC transporter substrate-binding protein n=1 Tax=Nevskia soli TaxID=418856 RepID=UPI00068D6784|nr:quinoprotein dehydrogenase-associated putative ABC transporter substrate-binding protein [Nevskia soli]
MSKAIRSALPVLLLAISGAAIGADNLAALRVCADPGNMPISNNKGEGFENKIAQVIAESLGTGVQYYYRPGIERGLTRTTLDADECDLMLDMPADAERVMTTVPLYRTTFVLAYRNDRGFDFKNLDDPRLKTLKVGVYQTSSVREALAQHDVKSNTVVHYLSHDADLVANDQPVNQMEQVVNGQLDVAAIWGPFAGYYKTVKKAPLVIQPVNLMDDAVPMEFDMALAVRMRNRDLHDKVEAAMKKEKDKIRAILVDFGVPLVKCESCLIDGDLPAHGPYAPPKPHPVTADTQGVTIAQLDEWLKHGAKVNDEFNNAVIADDMVRVSYLLEKKHANINARDLQGYTPLLNAIRKTSLNMVKYLIAHKANVNGTDSDGWTPVMTAAWMDDGDLVKLLVANKADLKAKNPNGLTALAIASQYSKDVATVALVQAGSDVNQRIGSGYTPLMLAVAGHADQSAKALIDHGADVNAKNTGGVTALMIAAAANQADLAAMLIKSGADTSAQNENGMTALAIAKDKDSQAVIKLLEQSASNAGSSATEAIDSHG